MKKPQLYQAERLNDDDRLTLRLYYKDDPLALALLDALDDDGGDDE